MREDVTLEHARRVAALILREYEAHLSYCRLCIPGSWRCPDANQLQKSVAYWQERSTQHESPLDMGGKLHP